MKSLKTIAKIAGTFSFLGGISSCETIERECCYYSMSYGGDSYTQEICSDGDYKTVKVDDEVTYTYKSEWFNYYDSWREARSQKESDGWDCE